MNATTTRKSRLERILREADRRVSRAASPSLSGRRMTADQYATLDGLVARRDKIAKALASA